MHWIDINCVNWGWVFGGFFFNLNRRLYFWLKSEKSKRNYFYFDFSFFQRYEKCNSHEKCLCNDNSMKCKQSLFFLSSKVHSVIVVIMNLVLQWSYSVSSRKSGQIHFSHTALFYQDAIFAVGFFSDYLISPTTIEVNGRNCLGK